MSQSSRETLQLPREQMRALGYRVVDILVEHFESLPGRPVTRNSSRGQLEARLREPLPEAGTAPEVVLEELQREVLSHIMHVDHPRFFAFIPSPGNFIGALADALASGFNVFAGTWLEASGPAEVELVTIDWLRQLCGLPDTAGGLFLSGGSMANLTALAVARQVKLQNRNEDAIVYCSDQTHVSIDRALRVLGFQPSQICRLASDDGFRLPLADFRRRVDRDRAQGKTPFCVVANAGTTNTGAVDPLSELAEFCQAEGIWLHADGAYGAPAVLSEKGRRLLEGLERVDSLSLDPHKWLFQPFEIGCLLVRERKMLPETFRILPEYLKDVEGADAEVNFCDYGIQLTRSFRALKLWMSVKIFGIEAFRRAVARGIALAELAERLLRQSPNWEVVTPAQLAIVSFRYAPAGWPPAELDALNQRLVGRMILDGSAMVSSTRLRGRTALRLCTINPRTSESDIEETIRRLEHLAVA